MMKGGGAIDQSEANKSNPAKWRKKTIPSTAKKPEKKNSIVGAVLSKLKSLSLNVGRFIEGLDDRWFIGGIIIDCLVFQLIIFKLIDFAGGTTY